MKWHKVYVCGDFLMGIHLYLTKRRANDFIKFSIKKGKYVSNAKPSEAYAIIYDRGDKTDGYNFYTQYLLEDPLSPNYKDYYIPEMIEHYHKILVVTEKPCKTDCSVYALERSMLRESCGIDFDLNTWSDELND